MSLPENVADSMLLCSDKTFSLSFLYVFTFDKKHFFFNIILFELKKYT